MLVQALAEYADRNLSEQLGDKEWEEKPVPVLIEIGPDGSFFGITPRMVNEPRGKKIVSVPQPMVIPKSPVNRNSGLHPLLGADDIKYVLGAGAWTQEKDKANAEERHQAFVELIRKAAAATKDEGLEACVEFYKRPDEVESARASLKDRKPGTLIALSEGGPVVMRPAVRSYWNEHFRRAFQGRVDSAGVGECIISGVVGPIVPTHEKIKGVANLGGQAAGVSLMSFDKPAFRSYGWEQNANSPVSPDRATAYVLALNHLLRQGGEHRRDVAGVGFVYWTKDPERLNVVQILDEAAPEQVAALLAFDPQANPDPNMFYMAGVAGNGARLLVRYWVSESLSRVKTNLKGWFEGLRLVTPMGQPGAPPKMWQLLAAIERLSGDATAQQGLALMRRAIEGGARPLGYGMLGAVLTRLRHPAASKQDSEKKEYRFTAARIGLVRLCVNDSIQNSDSGERLMSESLDVQQESPAYLCGRLLAEYEGLQDAVYRSAGEAKVNVTIADRYYSLASTNPKIAFPKIEGLARAHFRKLRRNNAGAMIAIERRVIELHERIGTAFPPSLDLDKQGRFALGYYHQKAERNRQIAEKREKSAAQSDDQGEEQEQ